MQNSLLIEIVAEYIPKNAIELYINHIRNRFNTLFESYRVKYKDFKIFFTKCRIVVYCDDLKLQGIERERVVLGPPLKDSYHKDNSPTNNLLGFIKKWNKGLEDIIKPYVIDNKEYVALKVKDEVFLRNLFIDNLSKILETGKFFKNMKWDETNVSFPRPIRNLVVIFRNDVLPVTIFKLQATNITINNIIELKQIMIKTHFINKYMSIMKKNNEIIDQNERKKIILQKLSMIKKENIYKEEDLDLVEHWIYECELPMIGIVEFDTKFMEIPHVFIEHILKNKSYVLPLYNKEGKLINKTIYVVNKTKSLENVELWLKEVISARLEDLKFYWENDLTTNIQSFKEKLKNIVFPRFIGNMEDKLQRIHSLSNVILEFLQTENKINKNCIEDILKYFKLDYVTQTFTEYPELEGYIIYNMLLSKEDYKDKEEFLTKIFLSYKPQNLNDIIPQQTEPLVISFLDKLDDIYSFIYNGFKPTSQEDPFFIRKKSTLVMYLLHCSLLNTLPIKRFWEVTFDFYANYYRNKVNTSFKELSEFFLERYKNFLIEKGYKESIINIVLQSNWNTCKEVRCKIEAIDIMRGLPFWQALYEVVNRTKRIVSKECINFYFKEGLLKEKQEIEVYAIHKEFTNKWKEKKMENTNSYLDFAKNFVEAYSEKLNDFFDNVFVEVEDIQLQLNRKNLLYQIHKLFIDTIADISQLH